MISRQTTDQQTLQVSSQLFKTIESCLHLSETYTKVAAPCTDRDTHTHTRFQFSATHPSSFSSHQAHNRSRRGPGLADQTKKINKNHEESLLPGLVDLLCAGTCGAKIVTAATATLCDSMVLDVVHFDVAVFSCIRIQS